MKPTIEQLFALFQQHPSVCIDTRKIQAGDIYIALKGANFDGNAFAQQALTKGAAYVVLDDPVYHIKDDERYVLVQDGLKALQDLALRYRKSLDIPVIGLTGSNGKTTTKELMASVLRRGKRVFATAGNFNNHIGVPLTLLAIPQDAEIAIVEMGANQPGDIEELVQIARPSMALITNIGKAHLERLGGLDGVQEEKGTLFRYIRDNGGTIWANWGDKRVVSVAEGIAPAISYGSPSADLQGEILSQDLGGMKIRISYVGWPAPVEFETQLSGTYNLTNILAAVAVGIHFGLSIRQLKDGISAYVSQNNRSQLVKKAKHEVWLDAYNANPNSMQASIQNIFEMSNKRIGLVLGDMLELGESSEVEHRRLGQFINQFSPRIVIGVGPEMKACLAEVEAISYWFEDVASAQEIFLGLVEEVDLLLLKGSRGIALEGLLEQL